MDEDKKIKIQRSENQNNMNYPKMYWINSEQNLLAIKIGDKKYTMSPNEAIKMFHENELFMNELHFLIGPEMFENLIKDIIENKIQEILVELDLKENLSDPFDQLRACCKVQEYLVKHNTYTSDILSKKENENFNVIDDLYAAVIENQSVCSSNSLEFQAILSKIGITVECVILKNNQTEQAHMSNIVKLNGFYYFFDSTLEQNIFLTRAKEGQDLILCCAGLGMQEYTEFYTPIGIFKDTSSLISLPKNMASSRIPQQVITELVLENRNKL